MILDIWEEKIINVSLKKDHRLRGDRTSGDRTDKNVTKSNFVRVGLEVLLLSVEIQTEPLVMEASDVHDK